jgi:hypothetical protein
MHVFHTYMLPQPHTYMLPPNPSGFVCKVLAPSITDPARLGQRLAQKIIYLLLVIEFVCLFVCLFDCDSEFAFPLL